MYAWKGEVPEGEHLVPLGTADVKRAGKDVTLVAYSKPLRLALEAADALAAAGIDAEVVDLRTLRPLDAETVFRSVRKTNRCVVVEESWPVASVGSHVAWLVSRDCFDDLDAPVELVAGEDVPMPYNHALELAAQPSVGKIVGRGTAGAVPRVNPRRRTMAEKVPMIALSPTMDKGTIVRWRRKVGDVVKSGDVICEVETDKATMDYESSTEGTLLAIVVPEGGQAAVGDTIAIVGAPGEDVTALAPKAAQPAAAASEAPAAPLPLPPRPPRLPPRQLPLPPRPPRLPPRQLPRPPRLPPRQAPGSARPPSPGGSRASTASTPRPCGAPAPAAGS